MAAKKDAAKADISTEEGKRSALDAALAGIKKEFGTGAILRMGENANQNIPVISTGNMDIDHALGVGGLPKGRIIEIYGPESSGKTTIALQAVAEAQKAGGIAVYIDAEHALDPNYAARLGVRVDSLYMAQPESGEQALDICETLVRSGAVDIIVVDSVAALVPKAEIEGNIGDSFVGLQARLMSQAMRKLTALVSKTGCICIFINQLREKIGAYGNPETTTGGRALKFYATIRMDIRRGEAIKEGGNVIGSRTKLKVVKNKVAPPFRTAEFDMIFGEGASRISSILDHAIEMDIIHKSGAWFSYNDEKIAQGRENTRQYLATHPELTEEIERIARARLLATDADIDEADRALAEKAVKEEASDPLAEVDDDFLEDDLL